MTKKRLTLALSVAVAFVVSASTAGAATILIDFNSGEDIFGSSQGVLYFTGDDGFQVIFTDDDSAGAGGQAQGVEITNQNNGNIKVGSATDFVLGAFNPTASTETNPHTSGIVATFNQGATLVSFDDTDNDATLKALFAYDEHGALIAQSAFASQVPVIVTAPTSGQHAGKLIYRVEFDTEAGTAGGSHDGVVFTIDNFRAEGVSRQTEVAIDFPPTVPEPGSALLLLAGAAGLAVSRRRPQRRLRQAARSSSTAR